MVYCCIFNKILKFKKFTKNVFGTNQVHIPR